MVTNSCFFSIIVPVYNVDKYLRQCVDSVLSQTFEDFELILVDDGSTDDCPSICDLYAEKDKRVKVIHKENGRQASARNVGLKNAVGEYVLFLDSDDYWRYEYFLEEVFRVTDNKDVIVVKYVHYYEPTLKYGKVCSDFGNKDFNSNKYEERIYQLISEQLFDACAWNKVFKRELAVYNDLYFVEGIIAEDIDWTARLMLYANSVDILDDAHYVYRKGRVGATTSKLQIKNIIDTQNALITCLNYPELLQKNDDFKKAYYNYVSYRYVIWLAENSIVKSEEQNTMFNEMKVYKWLLKYDSNKKVRLANYASRCLGLKTTAKLLGIYLRRRF